MKAIEMTVFIYAEDQEEVESCKRAVRQFIEDNRLEGRAVTAKKIAEALSRWKSNPLVKTGIINFLNKK